MASCKQCGTEIEGAFRFCPWCGHVQRLKLTEFFFGHAGIESGSRRALRISRYFGEEAEERHIRFSVWSEAATGETRVEAAVSLDEDEADRVARFLATSNALSEAETQTLESPFQDGASSPGRDGGCEAMSAGRARIE